MTVIEVEPILLGTKRDKNSPPSSRTYCKDRRVGWGEGVPLRHSLGQSSLVIKSYPLVGVRQFDRHS